MLDFIYENDLTGLFIGISTFIIIGVFHPVVIKSEYHFGVRCWWFFLLLGILGIIFSIQLKDVILSSMLGVFSFSSFWTILELFEQRDRVVKGWFPMNKKRESEYKEYIKKKANK